MYPASAFFGKDQGPTLIVDDGGDATLMLHMGVAEENAEVLNKEAEGEDERELYAILKRVLMERKGIWKETVKKLRSI